MLCQHAFGELRNRLPSRSGGEGTYFSLLSVLKVTRDHPSNYCVVLGGGIEVTWKHVSDSLRVFMNLSNLQGGTGLRTDEPSRYRNPRATVLLA